VTATMVLALTSGERTLWTVLLVVGLVVLAVVVVLLQTLYRAVVEVDEGAQRVWSSATRLARNTATTWQLGRTAEALEAVEEEARRHDRLLEGLG
jgi:uncharacterized membrane protein YeiB